MVKEKYVCFVSSLFLDFIVNLMVNNLFIILILCVKIIVYFMVLIFVS